MNDSEKIVEILQYFNLKKSEFSTKTEKTTIKLWSFFFGRFCNEFIVNLKVG